MITLTRREFLKSAAAAAAAAVGAEALFSGGLPKPPTQPALAPTGVLYQTGKPTENKLGQAAECISERDTVFSPPKVDQRFIEPSVLALGQGEFVLVSMAPYKDKSSDTCGLVLAEKKGDDPARFIEMDGELARSGYDPMAFSLDGHPAFTALAGNLAYPSLYLGEKMDGRWQSRVILDDGKYTGFDKPWVAQDRGTGLMCVALKAGRKSLVDYKSIILMLVSEDKGKSFKTFELVSEKGHWGMPFITSEGDNLFRINHDSRSQSLPAISPHISSTLVRFGEGKMNIMSTVDIIATGEGLIGTGPRQTMMCISIRGRTLLPVFEEVRDQRNDSDILRIYSTPSGQNNWQSLEIDRTEPGTLMGAVGITASASNNRAYVYYYKIKSQRAGFYIHPINIAHDGAITRTNSEPLSCGNLDWMNRKTYPGHYIHVNPGGYLPIISPDGGLILRPK